MKIYIIVFLLISFLLIFGINYFIYLTAERFLGFKIVNKFFLYPLLFASASSFIVASILTHIKNAAIFEWFYYAVSVWHGLLVYLLISSFLVWLLYLLGEFSHHKFTFNRITLAFFVLSALFSVYGIMKAGDIKVKDIEVKISGLPEEWIGKNVVQISDIHVGNINSPGYMEKVALKVNELKPEVVFITGDYFDGTGEKFARLAEPLKNLRTNNGIFFVKGNHEIYSAGNKEDEQCRALSDAGVTCLKNEAVDINGLSLIGLDYPADENSLSLLKIIDKSLPSILLYHEPRLVAEAKEAGINLQLAGHTHHGQLFPFSFLTGLIYGKYDYGLHTEGDYNIYTTSGTGTWGPPMRLGTDTEMVNIRLK